MIGGRRSTRECQSVPAGDSRYAEPSSTHRSPPPPHRCLVLTDRVLPPSQNFLETGSTPCQAPSAGPGTRENLTRRAGGDDRQCSTGYNRAGSFRSRFTQYHRHRPRGHCVFCLLPWLLPCLGSGAACHWDRVALGCHDWRSISHRRVFQRGAFIARSQYSLRVEGTPPQRPRHGVLPRDSRTDRCLASQRFCPRKCGAAPPYYHHIARVKELLFPVSRGCG